MVWIASLPTRWCAHHVIIFANTICSLQLTVIKVLDKHFKPSPSSSTSNITSTLPAHTSSSSPQLPLRLGARVRPMDSRRPRHLTNRQQKGAWWGHREETYPSGRRDLHQRVPSIWSSARRTAWILFSQIVWSFILCARLLIMGTPLQNSLKELFALLNFIVRRFCGFDGFS